jgi:hypothetical protein
VIEQVRELLKDKNVSVAVIVDDAYDTTPTADDLAAARWNSFCDDISEEDEQRLRKAFGPAYDELDVTELAKNDEFVQSLWKWPAPQKPHTSDYEIVCLRRSGRCRGVSTRKRR